MYEHPDLEREFNRMYEQLCKLEGMIRYKNKDVDRLTYLNQYLSGALKKRDDIILGNHKEIQRLKQLLILYQKKVNEIPSKEKRDQIALTMHSQGGDSEPTLSGPRKAHVPTVEELTEFNQIVKSHRKGNQGAPASSRVQTSKQIRSNHPTDMRQSFKDSVDLNKSKMGTEQKIPQNRKVKPIGTEGLT